MKYFSAIILWLLVGLMPARSQQPLVGLIQGTIVDQKQMGLPDAVLTATNIDSVEAGTHRRSTANDEKGFFQFVDVPMGRYAIVVSLKGYRNYKIPEVTVRGGETVKLPTIKMSPSTSR